MKKILLVLLIPFILFATSEECVDMPVDEYKTDIYFANGILNSKRDAKNSLKLILEEVKKIRYGGSESEMLKHHNFQLAFNESFGVSSDAFETFTQKVDEEVLALVTWNLFKVWIGTKVKYSDTLINSMEKVANSAKTADLSTQINCYKKSIEAGHGVIVIAHSQGNLFTNEAYKKLAWHKNYFKMMGVASPANYVSGGGPYILYDNDPVALLSRSLTSETTNPRRLLEGPNAVGEYIDMGALTGIFH